MDSQIYLFAIMVLVAAGLAGITIWSRRRIAVKLVAIGLAAILMAASYVSLVELLGRPKPVVLEWTQAHVDQAEVLAARLHEGEAIYVWLQFPDNPQPRAYAMPWDKEQAEELQQARRKAEAEGAALQMRNPFVGTRDPNEPLFHPEPPKALPPKTASTN